MLVLAFKPLKKSQMHSKHCLALPLTFLLTFIVGDYLPKKIPKYKEVNGYVHF